MHHRSGQTSWTDRIAARRSPASTLLHISAAATMLCATAAFGQFRASITGTVADPTGAVIPNATVTLVDVETNKTLTATSNASGVYTFNALPSDHFTLTAKAPGFNDKIIQNFTITPEQANNVDIALAIGDQNTTVTVTGDEIPPLETTTGSISGTISAQDIQHLPSAGRDVFQLTQLTPGVFGDGQRSAGGGTNSLPGNQGPGGSSNTSGVFATENGPQAQSGGGQYETNSINVDGISTVSAVWGGTTVITPNEDSIDNVKVTSNNYDAEFGRFSGANTQVTTKSGTNQFLWQRLLPCRTAGVECLSALQRPGNSESGHACPGRGQQQREPCYGPRPVARYGALQRHWRQHRRADSEEPCFRVFRL